MWKTTTIVFTLVVYSCLMGGCVGSSIRVQQVGAVLILEQRVQTFQSYGIPTVFAGQPVLVRGEAPNKMVVQSALDGSVLCEFEAPMQIPARSPVNTPPNVVAHEGELHVLYHDPVKGWSLASVEAAGKIAVLKLLPGPFLVREDSSLLPELLLERGETGRDVFKEGNPDDEPVLYTWRSSDLTIAEDGVVEGMVSVYLETGKVRHDPDERLFSDYWFRVVGGHVVFTKIIEHMGALDFRLLPRSRNHHAAVLCWDYTRNGATFYLQEILLNDDGQPEKGPLMSWEYALREDMRVESFELFPYAEGTREDEIRILVKLLEMTHETSLSSVEAGWELLVLERETMQLTDNREVHIAEGLYLRGAGYPRQIAASGQTVLILGRDRHDGRPRFELLQRDGTLVMSRKLGAPESSTGSAVAVTKASSFVLCFFDKQFDSIDEKVIATFYEVTIPER